MRGIEMAWKTTRGIRIGARREGRGWDIFDQGNDAYSIRAPLSVRIYLLRSDIDVYSHIPSNIQSPMIISTYETRVRTRSADISLVTCSIDQRSIHANSLFPALSSSRNI